MQALTRFFTIHYLYIDPLEQHRATGLRFLSIFALLLAVGAGVVVLSAESLTPDMQLLLGIVPILGLVSVIVMRLLNRGAVNLASWVYIGTALVTSLGLVTLAGSTTRTVMALAIPVLVAGVLLSRRDVLTVTGLTALGAFAVALVERYILLRPINPLTTPLPAVVLIIFFGMVEWLFTREFGDLFSQYVEIDRQLQTALALSEQIMPREDLKSYLDEFSFLLHEALDLQQTQIFLQDRDNPGLLRLISGTGLGARRALIQGRTVSLSSSSPLVEVFQNGSPMLVRATDMAHLRSEFQSNTQSELIVPIMAGFNMVGIMDLQSVSTGAFSPTAIDTLGALGRQLGISIHSTYLAEDLQDCREENERLDRQTRRADEEIRLLRREITGGVWRRFLEERRHVIGFDLPPDAEEPVPAADMPPTIDRTLKVGDVITEKTAEGYLISIPLKLRGEVLGALEFQIARDDEPPPRLLELATQSAERLALALDNARLVEQTQAFAYREQQVRAVSSRLQSVAHLNDLLALAAEEFKTALGSTQTHIHLELYDDTAEKPESADNHETHEGGAS